MNTAMPDRASKKGLSFRAITDADSDFLCRLYGTTREAELAMLPWTEEQKSEFIAMQFNAQHTFYMEQFGNAEFNIIKKNNTEIGRLYLDRRDEEFRIIDIALLPAYQKMGLGRALLQDVLEEAAESALPVTIHVEKNNPALSLYERLGFTVVEDQGVYNLMRWRPE
jgi:ribosomal protein S18 acetylase RimI-like enzyme